MTTTLSPAPDVAWTDELGAVESYRQGFIGPALPGCDAWGVGYLASEWVEQAAQLERLAAQAAADGYPGTATRFSAEAQQLRSCAHRLVHNALMSD